MISCDGSDNESRVGCRQKGRRSDRARERERDERREGELGRRRSAKRQMRRQTPTDSFPQHYCFRAKERSQIFSEDEFFILI